MMQKMTAFDRNMAAVAFAEANEPEQARAFVSASGKKSSKQSAGASAKKPVLQMVIFGAISLTGYIVIFNNERLVTTEFTMGGWHAAYPVLTALLFSFIHGAFASNLLSVLGLEAKKK
ncbi:MAG: hypothetical protein P8130_02650 [Deltaproteobacteria bacterium]